MKVEVYSKKLVTKKNLNGKGIIDINTPEGVEIFGGQDAVDKYKNLVKISDKIYSIAKNAVELEGG